MIPFYLCVILVAFQIVFDTQINNAAENRCGCNCTVTNQNGKCVDKTCGIEFSDSDQAPFCPISSPPRWPPLLQVPRPESRAVRTNFLPDNDLPEESCRRTGSCPVTILFTGNNHSIGESMYSTLSLSFFFGHGLYFFLLN